MSLRREGPAGTPCDRGALSGIYRRQFEELSPLRRRICSLLNLRNVQRIYEPGCGTGLLGMELMSLTGASYEGVDTDGGILPDHPAFRQADAITDPGSADLYVTSFFFSSLDDPVVWLKRVRRRMPPGGRFAVFAEYDYSAARCETDPLLLDQLLGSLGKSGLCTEHGGRMDGYFRQSGFSKLHGGNVTSVSRVPDRGFLSIHLDEVPDPLPEMTWRIVWGIWRMDS